ncbi:helix-turn-helix transcriptional regulator [Nocardia nova]|nr:helix-turn-helix transcriptional regulator [Nocardia nova]
MRLAIRAMREEKDLSQPKLADLIGYSRQYVSRA